MNQILSTKKQEVDTNGRTLWKISKKTSCFLRATSWIFFLFLFVHAQNLHQWGNISLFHGLPSDQVHAITQTNDGIFWFGTENGLAKFDGRRVQTIPLEDVTRILSLAVGKDGTLFVGTNNGAFYLQSDKFLPIEATRGQQINTIFSGDKTFFGTQKGQVLEFQNSVSKEVVVLDVPITAVFLKGDILYLGTESRGLLRFENGAIKASNNRPQPFFINDLADDKNFNLWLGSRAGKNESGLFQANFEQFGEQIGEVSSLKFDEKNDLWVGTTENGVYRFRSGNAIAHYTFENTSGGLRSNQIFDVFIDREGVIWFGTDKGVCRFDSASPFNYLFSEEYGGNYVRTLYQAKDGKIYSGTNKGLYVFDGEKWLPSEDLTNKSIYSIGENVENKLIIGTPKDNIRSVKNLNGKTYTAIFSKGLFENDKLIFAHNTLISAFLDKENLYLGTVQDGVLEFVNGQVKPLGILQNNAIREIAGTLEKGLWFATEKGLYVLQNNEIKAVIENTKFQSVLVKDDKVFAGSHSKGLFQVRFDDEFGWIFSNLNIEQGLPSAGIFAILPIENSLLIGTGKGISRYSANNLLPEIVPNRIISERVHSAKEIVEGIKLDYPQNTLTVEVIGLSSRTFPESFQYGYLLKNGKGEIVLRKLTKDSQISFENLPPGNYSVEIRAFNQDLISSEPFKFNFSVAKAPFPWTSTALAVLLIIAVIALVMAVIEQRQIVKKNKEIAAARFDLANEAERERRRIARDLHDQTLADLRKLMLKSDKLPNDNAEFRQEIESVSDEIRRICEDLSPSVLENVGLTAALEFLLSNTIENYKFLCPEGLEERLDFPSNVQMQIYRIAQEVLNNIKRHAEASFVEMKISDGEIFKMIIENDGKPFSPDFENLPKGRGISNIKSRAELIEAEFSWENTEDGKTIFTLQK
ncbi:MAG TPA: two-component regulator propeller domain-containing protein [Pyrinomonadaceae bacterium]|nr:two-component regulator propeller domain-containing protein [Pyrinomonadaceae bacterium]